MVRPRAKVTIDRLNIKVKVIHGDTNQFLTYEFCLFAIEYLGNS